MWWGDEKVVDARTHLPARLGAVLATTSLRIADDAWIRSSAGALHVRDARGNELARARIDRGDVATWRVDGLRIRIAAASPDEALPRRPLDAAWWASVALSLVCVALLFVWTRARVDDAPTAVEIRARAARLSHLAARSAASPEPSRSNPVETNAGAATGAANDPSETLPDTRAARNAGTAAHWRTTADATDLSMRGILATALITPRLARMMSATAAAFGSMDHAPPGSVESSDGRVHYGSIALGSGAGSGCPPGADCDPITTRVTVGDSWRPRAAAIARSEMQARRAAAPVIRVALPEMGELTMAYVKKRIRRDLLAYFQHCYNDRLEENDALPSGRVVVRFEVTTDGTVRDASIVSSAIAQPAIEACVTRVLSAAHFPTNETGARITYPFVFSSLMPDR